MNNNREQGLTMVIFSFFSGVGILDLGFQEAGFNIVFVNEFQTNFMKAYKFARKSRSYISPRYGYHVGDINDFLFGNKSLDFSKYIDDARQRGEIIGFIGGPPCPDFSVAGKNKGRDGDNGKLAKNYIEMILKYNPDFFLFENVKGLIKTKRHREYYEELKDNLINGQYILSDKLVNALSYGVPQDRERIILIGVLQGSELSKRIIFTNSSFAFPWTLGLPYDATDVKNLAWPITQPFRHDSKRKFQYHVPKDLTVEYWFDKNRTEKHQNGKDTFLVKTGIARIQAIDEGDTSRKSFKRLHRWRYSPTAAYGNNEVHLHPYKLRRLSVAEAMAIQSLPEWFCLPPDVSLTHKFKMVGNGVPFLVSKRIAEQISTYFI